jgi:uncharacterized protein (DUF2384 family)
MAAVETTTIRVRRSTQKRLAEEAELAGMSVIEVLDAAADILEEQRLLRAHERCYEEHGEEILEEMKDWLDMPQDGLPDDDWSFLEREDDSK